MNTDPAPGKGVVLYDGLCPFCRKSIGLAQWLDWRKRFHYQNCRDVENLPPSAEPLDAQKMIEEMHVVTADRRHAFAGFRAVRHMLWRFPLTMMFAPFMYVPGVPWVGGKVYRWVARNRFKIVPCDENGVCRLPTSRAPAKPSLPA